MKTREQKLARRRDYYQRNLVKLRTKQREHREKNAESVKRVAKKYRESSRETVRAIQRRYYQANRESINRKACARNKANRAEINRRRKQRRDRDINYRILCNLRKRMWAAVTLQRGCKSARTKTLIGCDAPLLRAWLQSQFKAGMSWGNYGEWHIDHRIPCAEFDLRSPAQQIACFHYSNLQPLWGCENMRKWRFLPGSHQAELPMRIK